MTEICKANPLNSLNQFKNIINKDVQNRRVLSISFHGYFQKQFTIEQRLVVKNNENMIKQHITLHMLLYVRLMTLMVLTYQCYRCLILQISALYQLLLDFNGCTWLLQIISLCLHKINAYPNAKDVAVGRGGTKNFSYFLRGYEKYLMHFHGA